MEDSAVSYWQKFGTIAFDTSQKAMLTSCHLKNPDPNAAEKLIYCCFSFTIRRDSYDMLVPIRSTATPTAGVTRPLLIAAGPSPLTCCRAHRPALIIGNFMPIHPKKHISGSS